MTVRGHVENGVVVVDEPAVLVEGAEVLVELKQARPRQTLAEQFKNIIGAVTDLPEDMAANHDRYIHGTHVQIKNAS